MNRFLNRKKTDDGVVSVNQTALAQLSSPPPSSSPGLKKSATSRWKKNKQMPEAKPAFNLATVLPPSDDFRTSLLMPNLSARFSMLREQDDPHSMLGKASDDSVLQPSRRSRIYDFGTPGYGLSDIAEVGSIKNSIRPPFANSSKHGSYVSEDGYASESESTHAGNVMSRSRPGEGNVLFGGRQKVYMIPKSGVQSTKSLGKAVYEDDMAKTAFQKHRQRERELQQEREAVMPEDPQSFDFELEHSSAGGEDEQKVHTPVDSARELSHSPSQSSYEKKRSTTSSVTRSEARSSTAATSVASQPANNTTTTYAAPAPPPSGAPPAVPSSLERSNTRGRRLYEQGLDQHMHEQQTSAMTRLQSIQKQRALNSTRGAPPYLQSTKSDNSIQQRQPPNVYALRTSPPPLEPLKTFGTLSRRPTGSPVTSGPSSPLSPAYSDNDEFSVLTQALEPGDRGKATAMGAFNKPKASFDEKQYLERQIQLQRTNSGALPGPRSGSARQNRIERPAQSEGDRTPSGSAGFTRSSSLAKKEHQPSKAFNVFQNAVARNQQLAGDQSAPVPTETSKSEKQEYSDTHRAFFGNISASDSEDEPEEPYLESSHEQDYGHGSPYGVWQPSVLPSVSEHPALRGGRQVSGLLEEDEEEEFIPRDVTHINRSGAQQEAFAPPSLIEKDKDKDSPTLGPSTDGISHMMKHLRNKSTASSNYPPSEGDQLPELPNPYDSNTPERNFGLRQSAYDTDSRVESTYTSTNSNPWDLDEADHTCGYANESADRDLVSPVKDDGDQYANSRGSSQVEPTYHNRASEVSHDSEGQSWQKQMDNGHTRNVSTETQQEREAFDHDLAIRRNAIQEKMQRKEAENARAVSPAPSTGGALKAFGLLRSKASRDSIADGRSDIPSKAMRMLGLGGSTPTSSASLNTQYERGNASVEMSRTRERSGSKSALAGRIFHSGSDQDSKRERGFSLPRGNSDANGRSPANSSEAARSRSNSAATKGNSRSRSRTGPYRDDLEKAMAEGMGSSSTAGTPALPHELTPRPSPDDFQQPPHFETRSRSNSSRVNAMTNYFDSKQSFQPLQTAVNNNRLLANGLIPSPSSSSMSTGVYPPSGLIPGPNPNVYSPAGLRSNTHTPPISGTNTPVSQTFNSAAQVTMPVQPALRNGPLRKKTVSKHEISEPIEILSSSSNMDTVDLPAGASLRNGMDTTPPPVPAMSSRRRRLFSISRNGRSGSRTESNDSADAGRSKTPDFDSVAMGLTRNNSSFLQEKRTVGGTPYGYDQNDNSFSHENGRVGGTPYGYERHEMGSPERIQRSDQVGVEGGFI